MNDIITVFSMNGIDPKIKARVIIKLGEAINYQYASNITEPIVHELVEILDSGNPIFDDESFTRIAKGE